MLTIRVRYPYNGKLTGCVNLVALMGVFCLKHTDGPGSW